MARIRELFALFQLLQDETGYHHWRNPCLYYICFTHVVALLTFLTQMLFGICLQVYNHINFKQKIFIWLEFLPQILFMSSIFGYLTFCIMYKWSVDWWALDENGHLIHNAPPNLLNMLIYMFLSPGNVNPEDQLYAGQVTLLPRLPKEFAINRCLCRALFKPCCC